MQDGRYLIDLEAPALDDDGKLARQHAPRIRFDRHEPFFPDAVGYPVFREDGPSLSFPREIALEGAAAAIEYAIWWDWDIQHLYELEHAWIYLGAEGRVIRAEASWHGGFNPMVSKGGIPLDENGRLVICSEPGKHAFAPSPEKLLEREDKTRAACGRYAGAGGLLVTDVFKDDLREDRTIAANQLVRTYLERCQFDPAFAFDNVFLLERAPFVPWPALREWIPRRVRSWVKELDTLIPWGERRVLRIAHRGASAYAQENSPAAIRKAAEVGADMVEIDIHTTADDVAVVTHDPDLMRVFGVAGNVADLTWAEIQARLPNEDESEPLRTFDQILALCRDLHVGLYLDIKRVTPESARHMIETLKDRGMINYVIFASFRPDVIADIKAAVPGAQTSILFASPHVEPVALAHAVGADFVHPCFERAHPQPHTLLTTDWLRRVREAGLGIITWHEERPDEIAALKALGVTGICSDRPDLLV